MDFELASGVDMMHARGGTKTTWTMKADMFTVMYRHMMRIYKHNTYPDICKYVRTFAAFGGPPRMTGLPIRYRLMQNKASDMSIVANTAAFLTCGPAKGKPSKSSRHEGALQHYLVLKRTGVKPVLQDPVVLKFAGLIEEHQKNKDKPKRRRMRFKQPAL